MAKTTIKGDSFAVMSIFNMTVLDYATGKLVTKIPYASSTGLEDTAEQIEVRGGEGNKLLTVFNHTKKASTKWTLPAIDFKLLALLKGATLGKAEKAKIAEDFTVGSDGTVTLSHVPLSATAVKVYEYLNDYDVDTKGVSIDATPDEPISEVISIPTLVGKPVMVVYEFEFTEDDNAVEMVNMSDKFPDAVHCFGSATVKSLENQKLYPAYLEIFKAQPQASSSLGFESGAAATIEVNLDILNAKDDKGRNVYYKLTIDKDRPIDL